jgi:hypothetical protein
VTKANDYPASVVPRAGIPAEGMHRTSDHRYYWRGEGPFPSVTTAMKLYDKSDVLTGWAKRETASFAVRHLDVLLAHREHYAIDPTCAPCAKGGRPYDRDLAARKWIAAISDYKRDTAADLGTEVHRIAEEIGKGQEPDVAPELLPYANTYRVFLDEYQPRFLAIEYMGLNREHGYAGTGDFIAELAGPVAAIDIKSWTKDEPIPSTYYPETSMQLAACSRFDFIGKAGDDTEYPMPAVEKYGVLLLGRDDYRLIPYFVTDETFAAFLACLSLYRWRNGEARTINGVAIANPTREIAA